MYIEYELNRAWILDSTTEDIIGETNFIVGARWLKKLYNKDFYDKYLSFDNFIEAYEPEIEGEYIYRQAIKYNALKEDLGIVMY